MRIWARLRSAVVAIVVVVAPCSAVEAETAASVAFTFSGRPASTYGETAREDGDQDAAARAVAKRLPGLTLSPALSRAAAAFAGLRLERGEALQPAAVEAALRWAGSHDPTATATAVSGVGFEELVEQVEAIVAAAPDPLTHVGLARLAPQGRPLTWGVVLCRRLAEVEAVPTLVDPGELFEIGFSLADGFDSPAVVVVLPGGTIVRPGVQPTEGGWQVQVDVGLRPGTAWIHLLAEGERGQVMVAQMSVAVGGLPISSWTPGPQVGEPPVGDVEAATVAMVRLVNQDRRRFGLPALAPDPSLMRVALDHTLDMSRAGFVGHESPARGGLTQRLEAQAYPVLAARENLSRAETVVGAQAALMMSPAHRANLLSADVTRLGVGVVADEGAGGRGGYLITQVFARPRVLPTGKDLPSQVRARLEAARRLQGWPQLTPSPELDRAADQVAAASAEEGGLSTEAMGRIKIDLFLSEVEWKAMRVDYHRVEGPEGVEFSEEALSALTRTVGIGAAETTDDGLPGKWVVVLVLLRR